MPPPPFVVVTCGLTSMYANIVEAHLILFYSALIKDLSRDVLGRNVDALGTGFVQHIGKESHLKLEAQNVHSRDSLLSALRDDFLHVQPCHGQIHRTNGNQPPCLLAVECGKAIGLLSPICLQNQVKEGRFLLCKLLLLLCLTQIWIHSNIVLAFVFAKIQNLEGAVVLAAGLQFPLNTDETLAGGVDGKFAEVSSYPLSTKFLRDHSSGARAAKEISNEFALVTVCSNNSLKKCF